MFIRIIIHTQQLLEKDSLDMSPPKIEHLKITTSYVISPVNETKSSFGNILSDISRNNHNTSSIPKLASLSTPSTRVQRQRRISSIFRCRTKLFSCPSMENEKITSPSLDRLARLSSLAPVKIDTPNKRLSEDFTSIINLKRQKVNDSQGSLQRHKSEVIYY